VLDHIDCRSAVIALPRDPISLPQRLRLVRAVKRIERVGSDAGAILGPRVVSSKNLIVSSESVLAKSERFGRARGDELVSLGFRVGNSSAIGWHQRRIFQHPCYP
jgi:hypothetical protein